MMALSKDCSLTNNWLPDQMEGLNQLMPAMANIIYDPDIAVNGVDYHQIQQVYQEDECQLHDCSY